MRKVSIFFDTKLISSNQIDREKPEVDYSLQIPRSLVCSNLQGFLQPNLYGQNITCEKHTTSLSHVSSGKHYSFSSGEAKGLGNISKIRLFFRSLEAKDLQDGLEIFQKYLCSLTNQLSTLQNYQPSVDHKPLAEWLPPGYKITLLGAETKESFSGSYDYGGNPRLKTQGVLPLPICKTRVSRPVYQGSQNTTFVVNTKLGRNRKTATEGSGTNDNKLALPIISKGAGCGTVLKALSLLRALRDIHASLNVLSIPQPTALYTVIKSPHVFKKTREQFATTANKKTLNLSLSSAVARSLVLESFLLLKLPCEVTIKA